MVDTGLKFALMVEVLCCTILTHMSDLEVKVTEKFILEEKHNSGELLVTSARFRLAIKDFLYAFLQANHFCE